MKVQDALSILPHLNKRGAPSILKVVKTAVANAIQAGISEANLKFKTVQIAQGPKLKRFRPVSKGRAHSYERKMSHIKIILTTVDRPQTTGSKSKKPKSAEKATVDSRPKTVDKKS
jgi:large subunit ribosomal protein L22